MAPRAQAPHQRCDDLILTARLRKLFPHDKHAGSHGSYRVSSLYFDTPYDKALREKLDSVGRREKFRLRYYNGDTSFVLLEKKFKQNGLCGKHKAVLSADEARQLLAGRDDFLLARPEALCAELYSKLRGQLLQPKTIVVYEREAFLYAPGNVRITLDRQLRSRIGEHRLSRSRADVHAGQRRLHRARGEIRRFSAGDRAPGGSAAKSAGGCLLEICDLPSL